MFFTTSHVFFAVWGKNEKTSVFFAEICHIYEIPGTALCANALYRVFLGV